MGLGFVKAEGAGNDLILLDLRRGWGGDLRGEAVRLCDRHKGIGGDGLMVVEAGPEGEPLVRMFNPDGSEDFCGNGLRCVAAWLYEQGEAAGEEVVVHSPRGRHRGRVKAEGGGRFRVEVELVAPEFRAEAIPVAAEVEEALEYPLAVGGGAWPVTCVSVGTAHAVIFVEALPADEVFERVSALIEVHEMFPERTSVLWCRSEGRERIEMRVWERGVGETLSCGTGACAAVAVGRRLGRTARRAEVVMRGGRMWAAWDGAGPARLEGPVRLVYRGELAPG